MTIKDIMRLVPGLMVVFSIFMGIYVNIWWLALAVFVGLNLVQSAFTKWCLLESILRKMGIPEQ